MKEQKVGLFQCDCLDRDHLIIAEHWTTEWSKGTLENEIDLQFVVHHCYLKNKNRFGIRGFFAEKWWRIKEALKILLFGSLRISDSWIPVRNDMHDRGRINPDGVSGEKELVKFANWILEAIEKSKEIAKEYRKSNN